MEMRCSFIEQRLVCGLGQRPEAPESDLPHLASLQLCPHEESEGPLPGPVQPQLRHLVVGGSEPRHPADGIPAAPRPQGTFPDGDGQTQMLRAEDVHTLGSNFSY